MVNLGGWCGNASNPCVHSPAHRKHFRKRHAHIYITICSFSAVIGIISCWAGYVHFLFFFYTLLCVCVSFYLRTTCDLWFWFMWFFHSTYVRALPHVCVHHTGKKKNAHEQVFHLNISNWLRLSHCKRHFHSWVGVYTHNAHIDRQYAKPLSYYMGLFPLREEAYCSGCQVSVSTPVSCFDNHTTWKQHLARGWASRPPQELERQAVNAASLK